LSPGVCVAMQLMLKSSCRKLGLEPIASTASIPVGEYIVDFACPAAKLAIELDGGQHALRTDADEERSEEIAAHGYRVLRFWNVDVTENLRGVLETICRELEISLSALGGGEGRGEVGDSRRSPRNPPHLPAAPRRAPPSPP